jgi:hypothetical protein
LSRGKLLLIVQHFSAPLTPHHVKYSCLQYTQEGHAAHSDNNMPPKKIFVQIKQSQFFRGYTPNKVSEQIKNINLEKLITLQSEQTVPSIFFALFLPFHLPR